MTFLRLRRKVVSHDPSWPLCRFGFLEVEVSRSSNDEDKGLSAFLLTRESFRLD